MTHTISRRRRPAVNISMIRASRLYRLIDLLAETPRDRDLLLTSLGVGLRTFYRELDLLRRCAINIQRIERLYQLKTTPTQARGRLPFPDPHLSFEEMAELATYEGDAARRLAELLNSVINLTLASSKRRRNAKKA